MCHKTKPGPLWSGMVAPERVQSISQIELFEILTVYMVNWIVWNRTAFTINCVQTKTVIMLN